VFLFLFTKIDVLMCLQVIWNRGNKLL